MATLVELLEDYGFAPHLVRLLRCKAIASTRLKQTRWMRRSWRSCRCAPICCRRRVDRATFGAPAAALPSRIQSPSGLRAGRDRAAGVWAAAEVQAG